MRRVGGVGGVGGVGSTSWWGRSSMRVRENRSSRVESARSAECRVCERVQSMRVRMRGERARHGPSSEGGSGRPPSAMLRPSPDADTSFHAMPLHRMPKPERHPPSRLQHPPLPQSATHDSGLVMHASGDWSGLEGPSIKKRRLHARFTGRYIFMRPPLFSVA